jgi:lipase ATG15
VTRKHTCTSRTWFGLICADPSPTSYTKKAKPTETGPSKKQGCARKGWFGQCKQRDGFGDEAWRQEI